jgi:ppGpp synthetase/RelA/SpoT-type nucleotidyltranferase
LKFEPRQKELDVLNSQINEARQQLTAGLNLGTAEEQYQRLQRAEHLVAKYDRKRKQLSEEFASGASRDSRQHR